MFLVMCGVVIAPGRTHICSQRKYGRFFLCSQDQGPSHMGQQPVFAGCLGRPAVWVSVCGLPDMAAFTADV